MSESVDLQTTPADLVALIRSAKLDLSTEKRLQADLSALLEARGVRFERELAISEQDRPDFMVDGGIALECKLRGKGRKIDIYKQLLRYASHNSVRAIVLVSNASMSLPPEINGKPALQASISTGWL